MNLNLSVVLAKRVQLTTKRKEIKKHPKERLKLKIFILEKIVKKKPLTSLKCIEIKKNMGWCNDVRFPRKYNKLIKIENRIKHEKLKRKDYKYDFLIPIKYNFKKPTTGLGSCIFIHLTKDYKPTAGCVALQEKDFLIMLKLIKKKFYNKDFLSSLTKNTRSNSNIC